MISTLTVSNTTTGSKTSSPYPVNFKAQNFGIGLGVTMTASKGIVADIEHTFDDPKTGFTNWHKHETLTSLTTATDGNYAFPITAIRINVTAQTVANGSVDVQIVQSE